MRDPSVQPHSNGAHSSFFVHEPAEPDELVEPEDEEEDDDDEELGVFVPPPATPDQPPCGSAVQAYSQCALAA